MKVKFAGTESEFIPGVPNRDMSGAEWNELTEERRAYALTSGLYVIEQETATKKAAVKSGEE